MPAKSHEEAIQRGVAAVGSLRASMRERSDPAEYIARLEEAERKESIKEQLLASAAVLGSHPGSSSPHQLAPGVHRVHLSSAFATSQESQGNRGQTKATPAINCTTGTLNLTTQNVDPAPSPRAAPKSLLDGVFNAAATLSSHAAYSHASVITDRSKMALQVSFRGPMARIRYLDCSVWNTVAL